MHFTTIPRPPIVTLKAELQALRASTPAILHQAIDARLDVIARTEVLLITGSAEG